MANESEITFEERKIIEKHKDSPLSGSEIGDLIGRHKNSINREFRICGGRANYSAKKVQAIRERLKENKNLKRLKEDSRVLVPKTLNLNPQLKRDFKSEFKQELEEINKPKAEELDTSYPRLPLKMWIDRFIKERSVGRKHWGKEKKFFDFWIEHLGDKIAIYIDPIIIEQIADELLLQKSRFGGTLSTQTRRHYLMYLSSLYSTAIKEWKWAAFNPITCVRLGDKIPKTSHYTPESFAEVSQIKSLFIETIRRKIKEQGLTMRKAAEMCKISLHCLQCTLDPNKNIMLVNFVMVCKGFGLKVSVNEY